MDKKINSILKAQFIARMAIASGTYLLKSIGAKDGGGPCLLERKIDAQRKAFISFGGLKDSDAAVEVEAGWTTQGDKWNSLEYVWLGDRPIPPKGRFDALIDGQLDSSPREYTGECFRLALPDVPLELQDRALATYVSSEKYPKDVEFAIQWEGRKKNGVSPATAQEQLLVARGLEMRLWSCVIEYLELGDLALLGARNKLLDEFFETFSERLLDRLEFLMHR